jgi:hypothetical protein
VDVAVQRGLCRPTLVLPSRSRNPPGGVELVEKLTGRHFESLCQLEQGRNLWIPFSSLDSTDLGWMDATALADFLLGQLESLTGCPEVDSKVAHAFDRRAWVASTP